MTNTISYQNKAGFEWNWLKRWQHVWQYRSLVQNLVVRDLKARYKNSILGILWSVLNPLGLMVVFTVLFSVMGRGENTRQFPVFILVGLMPWNFFRSAVTGGSTSITGNGAILKKVYFPREILPLANMLSNLVNFFFTLIVLVAFLYIFELPLTIHALWFPVILIIQIIFTMGLTLLLSAISVFYRDVMMILEVGMTAWLFLTPIFYSFDLFKTEAVLMGIPFDPSQVMRWVNPMASIIDSYRTIFWGTTGSVGPASMNPIFLLRTFVTAFIVFVIGYIVFVRLEYLFGEKL